MNRKNKELNKIKKLPPCAGCGSGCEQAPDAAIEYDARSGLKMWCDDCRERQEQVADKVHEAANFQPTPIEPCEGCGIETRFASGGFVVFSRDPEVGKIFFCRGCIEEKKHFAHLRYTSDDGSSWD